MINLLKLAIDPLKQNDSLAIFLSVIAFLVSLGILYLMYRSVRKEHKKYYDEVANYIDGVETKHEFIAAVNAYISRSMHAEFSLIYIDLDDFDQLVSNFGKEETNLIIKALINKLLLMLPVRVAIGRLKEDQFIIFTRGEFSREEVVKLTRKIVETVSEPIKVYDESALSLTCSAGIAHYPIHGRNYKELFDSCNIACYVCKREGGNQFRVYSQDTSVNEAANMEYYYQIKTGIQNKEFDIYYQPMVSSATGELYAFEGLLRWNHPELGLLSPYKFINIMEQTGDINWVGLWGLETIVKQYQILVKKIGGKEIKMSMNLSPKQLSNPSLPNDFQKVVKRNRVSPKSIILEVEEFAIFEKHEIIQNNLKTLHDLGFMIAVDGFGLDYKALKKIESMSIDVVKLNREYLDTESDQYLKEKFINILVDFASTQKKTLICEGVEDVMYLVRAKEMGLEVFQGYYFSKPMSSTETEDYIIKENWKSLVNATEEDAKKAMEAKRIALEKEESLKNDLEALEKEKEEIEKQKVLEEQEKLKIEVLEKEKEEKLQKAREAALKEAQALKKDENIKDIVDVADLINQEDEVIENNDLNIDEIEFDNPQFDDNPQFEDDNELTIEDLENENENSEKDEVIKKETTLKKSTTTKKTTTATKKASTTKKTATTTKKAPATKKVTTTKKTTTTKANKPSVSD